MNKESSRKEEPFGLWQVVILVLSVYVLGAMAAEAMLELPTEVSNLIQVTDNFICFIFLGDFFTRLYLARRKWRFLRWGWIDFISSIPMMDAFRAGRIFRLVRILRVLRTVRSAKVLLQFAMRHKARNAFASVVMVSAIMIVTSAVAILFLETGEGTNIKTAHDSLWWAFVTVTTVGYGDFYPVTFGGRLLAGVLMVIGVGLFGTFTAWVASWFINEEEEKEKEAPDRLDRIEQRLERIEQLLEEAKSPPRQHQ